MSIDFNERLQQICSASDDRSIRVWKICSSCVDMESEAIENRWKHCTFELVHTLFGHRARVWNARLLDDCIVSIGEVRVI